MSYIVFFLGLLFILLPFIPTLAEVLRKTDAQPLKISKHILRDPRSNPELLFWHFTQLLGLDSLTALRERVSVAQASSIQGSALLVPGGTLPALDKKIGRVISAESITLSARTKYPSKVLSMKSITTGADSALNEVHAMETLSIAQGNRVVWWASGENVSLESGVIVPGKIQAKKNLVLNGPVRFHLFEAQEISAGKIAALTSEPHTANDALSRKTGDFILKDGAIHTGSLIVTGKLSLGKNSKVLGNVKVYGNIELEAGAQVHGNLVGIKDIHFSGNNYVEGSVLTKENLFIGAQSQIGSVTHQITASAKNIQITGAFKVYGVLRAWKSGEYRAS